MGIDLGGTKIEGVVLGRDGVAIARRRIVAPRGDYRETILAIGGLVDGLEAACGRRCSIGVGMPGSISPATGLVQNANSTWLNGRPLHTDIEAYLGRPVRFANDANCFALSEATDGAGARSRIVFGVILGTGCGGGIVIDGRLVDGPRGIGGEWGHNPLPWPSADELQVAPCWCGRTGCLETWLSGPCVAGDHRRQTGQSLSCEEVVAASRSAEGASARATLASHADRLARGLATVVNLIDPDVIVLGGGLSSLSHLYRDVPPLMAPHIFADTPKVVIHAPVWGDAGGARGAAWLWD